jgi:two-component system chemotaxis response regulator CheB
MPGMDGIQVLHEIRRRRLRAKAIMVSSLTAQGAQVTTDALMEGAFDFILKPSSRDSAANRGRLRDALEQKLRAFREAAGGRITGSRRALGPAREQVASNQVVEASPDPADVCQAVVFGASTGGPEALKLVLPKLPLELPAPVLVVQHMPPQYTRSLAARLDEMCELDVVEAGDKTAVIPGKVFIAPGGRQTKLERLGPGLRARVTQDPAENGVRPSVDYLIRSAVEVLGGGLLAIIMTGMGRDGLASCRHLKEAGGYVFAECQDDCVVYGMPKAVIEADLADRTLPLGKIAPAVVRHVKRSHRS